MKRLKSENVDIPFILQHKLITPEEMKKFQWKTTVINGWDIQTMSPAHDFYENNDSYI